MALNPVTVLLPDQLAKWHQLTRGILNIALGDLRITAQVVKADDPVVQAVQWTFQELDTTITEIYRELEKG